MKRIKSRQRVCPNCGSRISPEQNFCPECGQENRELNVPLRHLIAEAVENVFHFDTKTIRSLTALLFRPGFLTLEFTRGKRASYVPPVRLYVFISFVFFLLLSIPLGKERNDADPAAATGESSAGDKSHFTVTFFGIESGELRGMHGAQLDSVMHARKIEQTATNRYIVRQMARIGITGKLAFIHLFVKYLSYMMFVLMPAFGLIVFLLFRKEAHFYLGTLIFSIHYHCFMFFILIFFFIASQLSGWFVLLIVPFIISPIYLFWAFRRVFGNSRLKTLTKTLAVGILQFAVMVALMMPTVIISIMMF